MPTYRYKSFEVTIASDGAIKVRRGDTISAYCAAIYQAAPKSTSKHWHEFGRMGRNGKLAPLANPNAIEAGETIYHIPSATKKAPDRKVDVNLITTKLLRLKRLREDAIKGYKQTHNELVAQKKKVDQFSFGLDMAGVVASAVVTGWVHIGKAIKTGASAADDLTKEIIKRTWGVGLQPQNQGLVQGMGQNLVGYGDNLSPEDDDHTVTAIGKILVGSFIDMTSPSYWSKKLAGGDPKVELDRAIQMNDQNMQLFLRTIDASIKQHEAILKQAGPSQ